MKDYTTNSRYLTYTFLFKGLGECTVWVWEWKGNRAFTAYLFAWLQRKGNSTHSARITGAALAATTVWMKKSSCLTGWSSLVTTRWTNWRAGNATWSYWQVGTARKCCHSLTVSPQLDFGEGRGTVQMGNIFYRRNLATFELSPLRKGKILLQFIWLEHPTEQCHSLCRGETFELIAPPPPYEVLMKAPTCHNLWDNCPIVQWNYCSSFLFYSFSIWFSF